MRRKCKKYIVATGTTELFDPGNPEHERLGREKLTARQLSNPLSYTHQTLPTNKKM